MCFPLDEAKILNRGFHAGHEWVVTHNGSGYRCGYVKVEPGHPWHGKSYDDFEAECHGGLKFARADTPCEKDGPDNGWWVGFDCAHDGDAPDPLLPNRDERFNVARAFLDDLGGYGTVRTQEYVETECRSLCEQASAQMTMA
jgi:hypothetical protein